ncbi:MAG TPA: YceI family protein [Pseudonocardiaceae bacterium]|nr:YceI family protein [Pseudonocardiaceae bacterium]
MNSPLTGVTTVEAPPAGDYDFDPARCTISFTTRHMFGLGAVRGTFGLREGHIHVADLVLASSARATIGTATVRTGNPGRDTVVRSAKLLDTDRHPDITFASTSLVDVEGRWLLRGTLTVHGSTQPVELAIQETAVTGGRLTLVAECEVDRFEFGITAMKGMVGRRLTLRLELTANRH